MVPDGLAGERLDAALSRLFGVSRTKAAELIESGLVQVDGAPAPKSSRVAAGVLLDVELPPPPGEVTVVPRPWTTSGSCTTTTRSSWSTSRSGSPRTRHPGWTGPTVIGHLAGAGFTISTSGAAERKGIVHRLDVGTSGLMVVAKTEYAYTVLKRAFKERTVKKIYHALVQGHPDPFTGTVDAPIDRHPHHDYKFGVVAGGKPSVTHYETLEAFRFATLLEITLETGRTHQIRVHMSAIGHPCCGDLTYGADPVLAERLQLTRQWLHAMRLGFTHPGTGEYVEFTSKYPDDLDQALDLLVDAQ